MLRVGSARRHLAHEDTSCVFDQLRIGKEFLDIAIPFALKYFIRIIFLLQSQKLVELRVTALHLLPSRVPMISQVVAPSVVRRFVDDAAAGISQSGQPARSPFYM